MIKEPVQAGLPAGTAIGAALNGAECLPPAKVHSKLHLSNGLFTLASPLRDQIGPDNHGARWRRCIPWRGAGAAAAAPSCVDGARSAGVRPVHLAIPTDCPGPARNRGGRPGSCCQRQASAGAPKGGSSDAWGCRCMHEPPPPPPPRVCGHGMTNRPLDAPGWPPGCPGLVPLDALREQQNVGLETLDQKGWQAGGKACTAPLN